MTKENTQRQFDWGPPVKSGDSFSEWLVYIVIIVIMGIGTWYLLDINGKVIKQKKAAAGKIVEDQKLEKVVITKDYEEAPVEKETENQQPAVVAAVPAVEETHRFYVQLGAFADEQSAREIFDMLHNQNIESTILPPDAQFEIYRLVVGPYSSEKEAESKAEQLNSLEISCFVVEG